VFSHSLGRLQPPSLSGINWQLLTPGGRSAKSGFRELLAAAVLGGFGGESLAEIIFYSTRNDIGTLVEWINNEPRIAWIIRDSEIKNEYSWRAVKKIPRIEPASYSLWHEDAQSLVIPSGSLDTPDTTIMNPFAGWR